jgi:hypothetical protein
MAAIQIIAFPSAENVISVMLAGAATVLACIIAFRFDNSSPGFALIAAVSFFLITSNSLFPLMGTLLEGHPISHKLLDPIGVFGNRLMYATSIFLAFLWFRSKTSQAVWNLGYRARSLFKTGFLLSPRIIWILGFIGIIPWLSASFHMGAFVQRFAFGFSFLSWFPFVLLLPPYLNPSNRRQILIRVTGFYSLHAIFSLALNSRSILMGPLGVLLVSGVMCILLGYYIVTPKTVLRVSIIMFAGIFFIGFLGDLSTAMLMERDNRAERSFSEQLAATYDRFWDKEALRAFNIEYQKSTEGESAAQVWQEDYIANPFLGRLVQVKFDDNLLSRVERLSETGGKAVWEITFQKLLAVLPEPVLQLFAISLDKKYVTSFSVADYIDVLTGDGFLGGMKVGSLPVHVYTLAGYAFPLVLIPIYGLIFCFVGAMVTNPETLRTGVPVVSSLALLLGYKMFYETGYDSLNFILGFLTRTCFEIGLMYYIALRLAVIIRK